jgi:hypothetical protein
MQVLQHKVVAATVHKQQVAMADAHSRCLHKWHRCTVVDQSHHRSISATKTTTGQNNLLWHKLVVLVLQVVKCWYVQASQCRKLTSMQYAPPAVHQQHLSVSHINSISPPTLVGGRISATVFHHLTTHLAWGRRCASSGWL